MKPSLPARPPLPLSTARACAWALLIAGWIGVGSFAMALAPSVASGFAMVAVWLLALGAAATLATGGAWSAPARASALLFTALLTALALWSAAHGGGLAALWVALLGWAALTALASGVVRGLRLAQRVAPAPPIAAAATGALVAGVVLGDVGAAGALSMRLGLLVMAIAVVLVGLQRGAFTQPQVPGCRAGLFDCSLPAWPAGAWRDPLQWPTLLAGLAMLPMMAALPWMAAWCRALSVPVEAMVLLHLAAMFGPAWLLRASIGAWSVRRLSIVCTALLVLGAALALWAPAPHDLLGLALAHGAAWGLAWGGQLWAPARRGEQGTSPLRAAAGYALLTLGFGVIVDRFGVAGVAAVHAALAAIAGLAWILIAWAKAFAAHASARTPAPPAAHPDHRIGGR